MPPWSCFTGYLKVVGSNLGGGRKFSYCLNVTTSTLEFQHPNEPIIQSIQLKNEYLLIRTEISLSVLLLAVCKHMMNELRGC